jgi:heme exporter protein D
LFFVWLSVMGTAGSMINLHSLNSDDLIRRSEAYSLRMCKQYRSAAPVVSSFKILALVLLDALLCALLVISTVLEMICLWIENVRSDRKRSGCWWS